MAIWTYANTERDIKRVRADIDRSICRYCHTNLTTPRSDREERRARDEASYTALRVCCCPVCGWWFVAENLTHRVGPCGTLGHVTEEIYGASGVLRNLDLSDQTVPLETVRQYLAAKYDARFAIDPTKFEEVVASVYSDLGYSAVAVGRSGDGGIDVVLQNADGGVIGVQVKRYREKIEASAIREFAGSLYLKGILTGIFVTTSGYTEGARATAATATERRIPVALVDAKRFYDQLGIAQRTAYERIDDPSAPYASVSTCLVRSYSSQSLQSLLR